MSLDLFLTSHRLIVIPLSFLRRLDSLKYTSLVALVSIGYLVILVVYHFSANDTLPPEGYHSPLRIFRWAGAVPTLASFPVIVFAYTCHQNMFSILNEISEPTPFRTTSVVASSIGSAGFIYILVAITGYLSFGNDVGDNIVGQYAPSVSTTIGRAAIVILVMFSYPLQVHPCRASVDAVLKWRPRSSKNAQSLSANAGSSHTSSSGSPSQTPLLPAGKTRKSEMSDLRFSLITSAIIILSYIVAMTVSSLSAVLAYVGSTGSTSISFILPGLFYYKISSPDSPLHQRLLKEEDDYDADDDDYTGSEDDEARRHSRESETLLGGSGVLSGSGLLSTSQTLIRRTRTFRRGLLRKLSLAISIYGICVMIVCLVTNTFFLAAH